MAVIAGNWKMHMGPDETTAFFEGLILDGVSAGHELIVFPPSVSLAVAFWGVSEGLSGPAGRAEHPLGR